ncbi:MAG: dephospho-CoA kinase [Oligoflexales bacterium]|nr:dephospho-CoA kinase [Oligoflexales bacterium]
MATFDLKKFKADYGVAITGNIATGKSTLAKIVADFSYTVIDADLLSREAIRPATAAFELLVKNFGTAILDENQLISRFQLRQILIASESDRRTIEKIIHPSIRELLNQKLQSLYLQRAKAFWFYEAALIFETNQQNDFNQVWLTVCSPEVQKMRLMQRDKMDSISAEKMIATQMDTDIKIKGSKKIFNTEQSFEQLKKQVKQALDEL